jgi:1,4-dihydroxy-2-naphthoate octaprenyltransferase
METAFQPLTFGHLLKLVEFRTKIISTSSVLIGTLGAYAGGHAFSLATAALFAAAMLCIDIGTGGFNSYFDFKRGVDTAATDLQQYKVLVQAHLNPEVALWLSSAFFGLAMLFGLALGIRVGWPLVGIGAACMAAAFLYSGGPRPLAATPVGELFAGGLLGTAVIILASFVQRGSVDGWTVWLSLPSTPVIACILTVNNTCDIEGDRRAGRRTMSILLGVGRSRYFIDALLLAAWGVAFALIPLGVLTGWAAVPLGLGAAATVRIARSMHRRGYSHATKGPSMGGISGIFMLFSLAMLVSLGLNVLTAPSA